MLGCYPKAVPIPRTSSTFFGLRNRALNGVSICNHNAVPPFANKVITDTRSPMREREIAMQHCMVHLAAAGGICGALARSISDISRGIEFWVAEMDKAQVEPKSMMPTKFGRQDIQLLVVS